MNFLQFAIIGIALSGPIVILIGMGRSIMCLGRCIKAKHAKFALFTVFGILTLLALLAAILAVWFGYGVAHTGKNVTTDLVVIASTVVPAYIGVFGLWRLYGYLEKRIRRHAT